MFCFLTGVIGADVRGHGLACEGQPVTSRLAVICGTSSCHMGVSLPGQRQGCHTQGRAAQRRFELLALSLPQLLAFLPPVLCLAGSPALAPTALFKFARYFSWAKFLKSVKRVESAFDITLDRDPRQCEGCNRIQRWQSLTPRLICP